MGDLFLTLVERSLAASWLILAVVLLRVVLKKAPKWVRCVLWALVAVRLVCPVSVESAFSLIPDAEPVLAGAAEQVLLPSGGAAAVSPGNAGTAPSDAAAAVSAPGPAFDAAAAAAAVWLAGVAALLLYALFSTLRLRRRVRAAIPLEGNVWLCDAADSPFILGVFRPRIYLPSNMDADGMGPVLAHEWAHLKRRDHWWKPLGFVLLAVYWFNPLVWLAYVLLCRDIELACDEKVIRELNAADKKAYSQALLACSVKRSALAACPLAFGEVGVKARVRSVLRYKKPAFWIILAAAAACVVLAVCFLTDPPGATVSDVLGQDGYGIKSMVTGTAMDITVRKEVLPDNILELDEWHEFEENEVVLYQTETTTLVLESAGPLLPDREKLGLKFTVSYRIPRAGTVRIFRIDTLPPSNADLDWELPYLELVTEEVRDASAVYPNGVTRLMYGGDDGTGSFYTAVPREIYEAASEFLSFRVGGLTDVTYEKGPARAAQDIEIVEAGTRIDGSSPGVYANGLTFSRSLPFDGLAPGEEYTHPATVTVREDGSRLDYLLYKWEHHNLTVTVGLRAEDGTEICETVTPKTGAGTSEGALEGIPAGTYTLFVRCSESGTVYTTASGVLVVSGPALGEGGAEA